MKENNIHYRTRASKALARRVQSIFDELGAYMKSKKVYIVAVPGTMVLIPNTYSWTDRDEGIVSGGDYPAELSEHDFDLPTFSHIVSTNCLDSCAGGVKESPDEAVNEAFKKSGDIDSEKFVPDYRNIRKHVVALLVKANHLLARRKSTLWIDHSDSTYEIWPKNMTPQLPCVLEAAEKTCVAWKDVGRIPVTMPMDDYMGDKLSIKLYKPAMV